MARGGGKAPKQITWLICLVLYLVAVLAHFGIVHVRADVAKSCSSVSHRNKSVVLASPPTDMTLDFRPLSIQHSGH